MEDKPSAAEELVADLKKRADRERAEGRYADADELAAIELEVPTEADMLAQGFDLGGTGARVRFRPELGFSSKPVVGPLITGVKKLNLRLLFYVFDDLARQTDAAITRLEAALAAEVDARAALEREVRALSRRVAVLEDEATRNP